MRLAFAGTPEFARVALVRLLEAGHAVDLVLTQPDRPAGRGLKLQPSPVKQEALAHGLPLAQPRSLRLDGAWADEARAARQALQQARPDALVVAAYGLLLPPWALELPRLGCLNIHASLLPRWRGAAPIHRAVQAGDAVSGVTIMQMDEGLDTGAMLLTQTEPLQPDDTTGRLHDRLARVGADLIVQALALAEAGTLRPVPQPDQGVCYAAKIGKDEARIDWQDPASTIARRVRALNPAPGANAVWGDEAIKVWQAQARAALPSQAADAGRAPALPGQVLAAGPAGVEVQAGDGVVVLTELQRAGSRRMAAADFLRGFPLPAGGRFAAVSA
ncbi:MAG: methionyl-tRNA formyltransferase [Rhodoferax sp.]|nr:methionyl-tRNA formyltransferase [Rhodoferax sp.]